MTDNILEFTPKKDDAKEKKLLEYHHTLSALVMYDILSYLKIHGFDFRNNPEAFRDLIVAAEAIKSALDTYENIENSFHRDMTEDIMCADIDVLKEKLSIVYDTMGNFK